MSVKAMAGRRKTRPLEGKTFVFAGKLEHYTRDEAGRHVEERGGRAISSVSGETDDVVAGENPGRRLDEAKKEKVPILDEASFETMIEELAFSFPVRVGIPRKPVERPLPGVSGQDTFKKRALFPA